MQNLTRASTTGATYSSAQVTDLINFHGGYRRGMWRVDLLRKDKSYKSDLTPFIDRLTIAHDTTRAVQRTCTLDMVETAASQTVTIRDGVVTSAAVDYINDLAQVYYRLGAPSPDGGWIEFSLGIFKFKRPGAQIPGYATVRTADLSDLSYIPNETQSVTGPDAIPLTLPAGASLIDVVRALLVNSRDGATNNSGVAACAGVPGCTLPAAWIGADWPTSAAKNATIPPGYTFTEGETFLSIINHLLFYIHCYNLWVDESGVFRVTSWPANLDYRTAPVGYTYSTQTDSIITPGITEDIVLDELANEVDVVVEDAARNTAYATAINTDPQSPISTANYDYPIVKVVRDPHVPDATDTNWAAGFAKLQLIIASYLTDRVTFTTAVNPAHQNLDVLSLQVLQNGNPVIVGGSYSQTTRRLSLTDKFLETAWTINADLPAPGSASSLPGAAGVVTNLAARAAKSGPTMTHTCHRIISLCNPDYITTNPSNPSP